MPNTAQRGTRETNSYRPLGAIGIAFSSPWNTTQMVAPTDPMRTDLQNHQLSLPLAREAENGHLHYLLLEDDSQKRLR